jgi:signal peptidase
LINNKKIENKQPSKTKKTINTIVTVIIICVFIVALTTMGYLFIQLLRGETPSLFGYRFYYVLTDSMSPTIEPKDVILSKIIEDNTDIDFIKENIHEGDIVTYVGIVNGTESLITHRVIKSSEYDDVIYYDEETSDWMLITKGDNNIAADIPISITKLNAIMVCKINFVGFIYNVATSTWGGIFLIGIPIVVLVISIIYRIAKAYADADNEEKAKEIANNNVELNKKKEEIARKAIEEFKSKQK